MENLAQENSSVDMDKEYTKTALSLRNNRRIQKIFEALLLDKGTPERVFEDLFGVDKSFVVWYKENHRGIWELPRLLVYDRITRITDSKERDIFLDVYNSGWEIIDALFNHGRNINAGDAAMKILKVSAAKSFKDALEGAKLSPALINAAKTMVSSAREYNNIDSGDVDEEWKLIVEELSKREKARKISPQVEDAMRQVMDVVESKKPVRAKEGDK